MKKTNLLYRLLLYIYIGQVLAEWSTSHNISMHSLVTVTPAIAAIA